jgi:hypothetical protein
MSKNSFDILFESVMKTVCNEDFSQDSTTDPKDFVARYMKLRDEKEKQWEELYPEFIEQVHAAFEFVKPENWIESLNYPFTLLPTYDDNKPKTVILDEFKKLFSENLNTIISLSSVLNKRWSGNKFIPSKEKINNIKFAGFKNNYYRLYENSEKIKSAMAAMAEYEELAQNDFKAYKKIFEKTNPYVYIAVRDLKKVWNNIEVKPIWLDESEYNGLINWYEAYLDLNKAQSIKDEEAKRAAENEIINWANNIDITPEVRKAWFKDYGWANSWNKEKYAEWKKALALHKVDKERNPELHIMHDQGWRSPNNHVSEYRCSCGLSSKEDSSG